MKTPLNIALFLAVIMAFVGCTDREAEARKAREDAEAKARAEAARKEMDALPKVFQTPDYFKRSEPEKNPAPSPTEKKTNP